MIEGETKKAYNKTYYLLHREKAKISNKTYKLLHSAELKVQMSTYYKTNKERLSARKKSYYMENRSERLSKDKFFRQTPKGKAISKRHKSNRRGLNFVPLNEWFTGSEAHHVDKEYVIYVPMEMHQSNRHSLLKDRNMGMINGLAFKFLKEKGVMCF